MNKIIFLTNPYNWYKDFVTIGKAYKLHLKSSSYVGVCLNDGKYHSVSVKHCKYLICKKCDEELIGILYE